MRTAQWSPEEIRNRMKLEGIEPISHESTYRRLWADKKEGGDLHTNLRHKIRSYRRRGSPRKRRGRIPGQRMIGERPPEIEHRERIGDYEMDTVIGTPSGEVLATMAERRSRLTFILKAFDRSALKVSAAIVTALLPHRESVHTLTYDKNKEFARHALIDEVLGSTGYFAQPYHSWERGLNENTNGLIRQYFPKQSDFGKITDEQIREVQEKLNDRPRKCLGWRTPGGILRPSRYRCTSGLKPPFQTGDVGTSLDQPAPINFNVLTEKNLLPFNRALVTLNSSFCDLPQKENLLVAFQFFLLTGIRPSS